jgi:hypothetical protein
MLKVPSQWKINSTLKGGPGKIIISTLKGGRDKGLFQIST